MTIVTMVWPGPRGYTVRHAEAVAAAVARHATFPYRFVCITDAPARKGSGLDVWPLPDAVRRLAAWEETAPSPLNLPKMWLFSAEAAQLGPCIFYLDADSLVTGDLAPLVQYAPDAPFLGFQMAGKLCTAMFRLQTGALQHVWTTFTTRVPTADAAQQAGRTDQGWMRDIRNQEPERCWPNKALGIYGVKELEEPHGWPTVLPAGARIVHPTGKVKPGTPAFVRRHPWAQEHYPCLTTQ